MACKRPGVRVPLAPPVTGPNSNRQAIFGSNTESKTCYGRTRSTAGRSHDASDAPTDVSDCPFLVERRPARRNATLGCAPGWVWRVSARCRGDGGGRHGLTCRRCHGDARGSDLDNDAGPFSRGGRVRCSLASPAESGSFAEGSESRSFRGAASVEGSDQRTGISDKHGSGRCRGSPQRHQARYGGPVGWTSARGGAQGRACMRARLGLLRGEDPR
jgi:hypothetical protein